MENVGGALVEKGERVERGRRGVVIDGVFLDEAALDAKEVELAELSAHLDAATHRQLTLIRVMDLSERWAQRGAKSCAHWLSWRVGLDPGAARERVRVARKLGELPAVSDSLRRGVLSYSKARAITRVGTPANEERLLDMARHSTAAQLEKICRGVRQQQREDARIAGGRPAELERYVRLRHRGDGTVALEAVLLPDEGHRAMEAVRVLCAAMGEGLEVKPDQADALVRIFDAALAGDQPVDGGDVSAETEHAASHDAASRDAASRDAASRDATINDAMSNDAHATRAGELPEGDWLAGEVPIDGGDVSAETEDEDAIGHEATSHDATSHDATSYAATARDAGSGDAAGKGAAGKRARTYGADRAQVVVHFTKDMIDGGQMAVLDDGGRVCAETFRRMACDCSLLGVLEDGEGEPLDVGRKSRRISPALRRAVMLRDRGCRFPGCTHDRYIDLHHREHWIHGGETTKANLLALCTFHHRLVHEGGFTIELDEAGEPLFVAPEHGVIPFVPTPAPVPDDAVAALEEMDAELGIHEETGLACWDGMPVDYGACVGVVCAADEAPDLHLSVGAWLAKHGGGVA